MNIFDFGGGLCSFYSRHRREGKKKKKRVKRVSGVVVPEIQEGKARGTCDA